MMKYPYKDEELKVWIYDSVPDKMELATSEKQLKNKYTRFILS